MSKIFLFKAMQGCISDIKNLLEDETTSDVVFVIGSDKVKGHRQIIGARCDVMKKKIVSRKLERSKRNKN